MDVKHHVYLLSHIPFGHRKTLHTLTGKGSAALAAAVPLLTQVRLPQFPARDKEVLKYKQINK